MEHNQFSSEITPTVFAKEVEKLVKHNRLNYIEAATTAAQSFSIELDAVPALLTATLKQKIESDAIRLHHLKYKTPGLPFAT